MNVITSPASFGERGAPLYVHREHFEVDQYVRVQVTETRYSIGVVTHMDEAHDRATVETRNGYEVTVPISALRRAFLLVLDLNGVLVARGRGSFVLRPNAQDFLKFAFANFVVAVWTSGLQRSSNPIIDHVFGNYRDLLLFTLFRESCVAKPSLENPYGTEKNLQVIFDKYPQSFHSVNTIIIDDSPAKCSHPDIALCPIPFKDPVAQVQDAGLLQTMDVLKEVLLLDSGVPLILAAEQRLQQLAEQQQVEEATGKAESDAVAPTTPTAAAASASTPLSTPPTTATTTTHAGENRSAAADMEEVELWKTRLCCDQLQGRCARGDECPFSHEKDDGRPCSRKSGCRQHGSRWPKTTEETRLEEQRRESRKVAQQRYDEMQKRREDHLEQLQRQSRRNMHKAGNRHTRRGGDGGGGIEDDDSAGWATATTGFSHTGDPTYDNMVEQQQQQRRGGAPLMAALTTSTARTSSAAAQGQPGSDAGWPAARLGVYPPPQTNSSSSSTTTTTIPFVFQTASIGSAAASPLMPFSTRPMAPPAPTTDMYAPLWQQQLQQQCAPSTAAATNNNNHLHDVDRRQRGGGGGGGGAREQQHRVRISSTEGDSTAVVSQLQALMRQR
ncbi:NLI interacting factor-like phosphatase/Zinc finger C-x8-C-x5-C-x3-H type (and similar) [Novymonas esmeraldas]|uniref:NLI interacting factor-like phosphatase/Zinc finger C-x8-C-x5-C-x3-H type (And similar) n=1 Tax=Novymonas esmeraldas TaxID=1808958 RepID=A0AAW0EUU2_9TRYP